MWQILLLILAAFGSVFAAADGSEGKVPAKKKRNYCEVRLADLFGPYYDAVIELRPKFVASPVSGALARTQRDIYRAVRETYELGLEAREEVDEIGWANARMIPALFGVPGDAPVRDNPHSPHSWLKRPRSGKVVLRQLGAMGQEYYRFDRSSVFKLSGELERQRKEVPEQKTALKTFLRARATQDFFVKVGRAAVRQNLDPVDCLCEVMYWQSESVDDGGEKRGIVIRDFYREQGILTAHLRLSSGA